MAKSKLRLLRTSNKLEFYYEDEFYVFERRSDGKLTYDYIWKDTEKIFGPMITDETEEGLKIHKIIMKKLDQKEIHFLTKF